MAGLNMKILSCSLFILISFDALSVVNADSSKTKLKAGATISLNSNGVASIPAFSLGKPAVIATVNLSKGRFSYDPCLAYGLDLRPWYIDNWFHYRIIKKPVFELRTGFNISSFFTRNGTGEDITLKGERYFDTEIAGMYNISENLFLSLIYWTDSGLDKGTIQGHFLSIAAEKSEIKIGGPVLLAANIQLFYIDYNRNNDGLFLSPRISFSIKKMPFEVFFQAIQAVASNIDPFPGFRWNAGLSYQF